MKQLVSLPFYQNKITTYLKEQSLTVATSKTNGSRKENKDDKDKRQKNTEEE